jgi:hypothetical protein
MFFVTFFGTRSSDSLAIHDFAAPHVHPVPTVCDS